ncbi:FHA domain-containing protein [Nannocystis pusilla]|uniref:FHA domain-containing protein n=1 Tax=Nannocystis pusilla TaxID=889268 RepID=UPI003B7B15D7
MVRCRRLVVIVLQKSGLVARIQTQDGSSTRLVPSRCLIGRSSACQLRVDLPETSNEHALLRWRNGVWEMQDLHSRNGTYVDGRRLGAGRLVALREGARLGFGYPDQYTLVDAGPPEPHAVSVRPPHCVVEALDGLLALPGPDEVEVTILERDRRWWIERDDAPRPIGDGEVVLTRTDQWRLHLPELITSTRDAEDVAPSLAALSLRFLVDDDGVVELVASRGDQRIDLKARAHHAPLLALARARLAGQERFAEEQGWIEQEELLRRLGCDANRLHVDLHRIRRQFAAAGIIDAVNIIERREGRRLRIGVSRLEIVTDARPHEAAETMQAMQR